jgi:long-chain acyl-CoA synthetase
MALNPEDYAFQEPEPDTVFLFCYTSGTTGDPKAVQLSHKNTLSVSCAANYAGVEVFPTDTVISYLPLAHSFE